MSVGSDVEMRTPPDSPDDVAYRQLPSRGQHAQLLSKAGGGGRAQDIEGHTFVSIPETAANVPMGAGENVVITSRGGDLEQKTISKRRELAENLNDRAIDIVVYTADKGGLRIPVEDGQHVTAGELFEMVMDENEYGPEARDIFSLWLVSDLLELQLKPNQVPFKLVCYWEELLCKYTTAAEEDIERDEPVIMFQRNAFYSRKDEVNKIQDEKLHRLLFYEAKENVLDKRYPLTLEEYINLAGLQAYIMCEGNYDSNTHTAAYYKSRLAEFLPEHIYTKKRSWPFTKSTSLEEKIVQKHEASVEKYEKYSDRNLAIKAYLDVMREKPYYGAAFFHGQIEHPGGGKFRLRSSPDDPVWVAINPDGVSIIDMDDVVYIFGLPLQKLRWDYAEPVDAQNQNCIPSFFLEFPEQSSNSEKLTKVLQIFSRSAVLMDCMVDSCRRLVKSQSSSPHNLDTVDGPSISSSIEDIFSKNRVSDKTWNQFDRLCLATFDLHGNCIENRSRGSTKSTKRS